MTESPQVLLATCSEWKNGEPGHDLLEAAFAQLGVTCGWASWDDPYVDWSGARRVVARSTWDMDLRHADFLGWAGNLGPSLLHGVEVFRWNTDKAYLADIAKLSRVPVVPTVLAHDPVDLRAAISRLGPSVVKPRVGAQGRGLVIVYDADAWLPVDKGPWVVQPLLDSIFHEGEVSVFVINGHPVSQVNKVASRADIRVGEQYGGEKHTVQLTHEAALLAVDAVAASTEIVGHEIVYARVDMLRSEGKLLVREVDVTSPSLYLDVAPENAGLFAAAIADKL